MRIGIRWRLMILLLAFAVLPLAVVTWTNKGRVESLGRELADRNAERQVRDAKLQLAQLTAGYAKLAGRQSQLLELWVQTLAREIEQLLDTAPDPVPKVVFAHDFDDPELLPQTSTTTPDYIRFDHFGGRAPLPVTLNEQAFRVVQGVEYVSVVDDIARLVAMNELYRVGAKQYGDFVHWQYFALENGLASSFPGHGGYPAEFDARERPRYVNAKVQSAVSWSLPNVDVGSREIIMSISAPVFRRDGQFAGVTGVDVQLATIFKGFTLPAAWAEDGQLFIVVPGSSEANPKPQIVAKQRYDRTGFTWQSIIDTEPLRSTDEPQFHAVMTDLRNGRAGERELEYAGHRSLWAYRPFTQFESGSVYLFVIVPYRPIEKTALAAHYFVIDRFRSQLSGSAALIAVVLFSVIAIAFFGSRTITTPVQRLAETARRVAAGDLAARAEVQGSNEFQALAETFNAMVPQLQERVNMLQSLQLAHDVQQNLLPQGAPDIDGLDVWGVSRYCDETGGDYYDFLDLQQLKPGLLGIALGDVSGHGVPSALLMTTVRALLRSYADQGIGPATIMDNINRYLNRDAHGGRFMTLFYGTLDPERQALHWASAGHDPVIIYLPDDDSFFELEGNDIPLGVDPDWHYTESVQTDWQAGMVALVGTDGIWETRSPGGVMFGKERLKTILRDHNAMPAKSICEQVMVALDEFRVDGLQTDDITLVVARFTT